MVVYVLRRLLQAIPLLVGISVAGFVLLRISPTGRPVRFSSRVVGTRSKIPSGGIATLGVLFSIPDRLLHLIGPASVLGLWMTATWSRYTRSMQGRVDAGPAGRRAVDGPVSGYGGSLGHPRGPGMLVSTAST